MGGEKRSRSAQAVAAERAVLVDLGVVDDPWAEAMLATPSMDRIAVGRPPTSCPSWVAAGVGDPGRARRSSAVARRAGGCRPGRGHRPGRHRRRGLRQPGVALGARWRAVLRARPSIDARPTSGGRAPAGGPTYVAADLRTDSAAEALVAAGMDPARPTAFVLEGLTMYLSEDIVRRQLRGLAEASPRGSRLSTDFYPPPDAGTAQNRRQNLVQRLARSGSGEDLHLAVDRDGAVALLESEGWAVVEAVSGRGACPPVRAPVVPPPRRRGQRAQDPGGGVLGRRGGWLIPLGGLVSGWWRGPRRRRRGPRGGASR